MNTRTHIRWKWIGLQYCYSCVWFFSSQKYKSGFIFRTQMVRLLIWFGNFRIVFIAIQIYEILMPNFVQYWYCGGRLCMCVVRTHSNHQYKLSSLSLQFVIMGCMACSKCKRAAYNIEAHWVLVLIQMCTSNVCWTQCLRTALEPIFHLLLYVKSSVIIDYLL